MSLSKVEGEPTLRRRRDRGFHHKRALAVNSRCLAREAREKTPREDHTQTQAASDAAGGRQGAARRGWDAVNNGTGVGKGMSAMPHCHEEDRWAPLVCSEELRSEDKTKPR